MLWPFQLLLLWLGNVGGFCLETVVGKVRSGGDTVPDPTDSSPAPILKATGLVLPGRAGSGSLDCFPGVPEEQ